MIVIGKSWKGRVRSRNEDVYWSRPELKLCGVADGMGGYDAGHIAARMTADAVTEGLIATGFENLDRQSIEAVVKKANVTVHARGRELADVRVMGATMVLLQLVEETAYVCHVGDSRAYRLRDGELTQLTRDHSVVNKQLESGEITEEEANKLGRDTRVTQAMGPSQVVSPTVAEFDVAASDLFMLCSDGLTGFVENQTLASVMNEFRTNINVLLTKLIDAASEHGSTDNITVVLAEQTE